LLAPLAQLIILWVVNGALKYQQHKFKILAFHMILFFFYGRTRSDCSMVNSCQICKQGPPQSVDLPHYRKDHHEGLAVDYPKRCTHSDCWMVNNCQICKQGPPQSVDLPHYGKDHHEGLAVDYPKRQSLPFT